ncbi:hypothetical protein [Gimesia chilikensis]|nr:hypothetical protein [Gimesia chilikensis]
MPQYSRYMLILLGLTCLQAGCRNIPDYHQPAGFSSTYHKRIYPETAIASASDASAAAAPQDRGVFYPTDVKVKQPKYVAPLAEVRGPITSEELQQEQRKLQLDSMKREDNYINQEPMFNENFPAPTAW